MRNKLWTDKEIEILRKIYPDYGMYACLARIKRSKIAVNAKLRRLGIVLSPDKYIVNNKICNRLSQEEIDFFRKCNTPEAAYILGFIWADGYLYKGSITINIVRKDHDQILRLFNERVWRIYYQARKNRQPQVTFYLRNNQVYLFLADNDYLDKSGRSADIILSKIPLKLHPYWCL